MSERQQSHDDLLDLAAVYALGAVNAEDARAVSAHIAVCSECREEYDALKPAADAVALSADDRLDARYCLPMKARLMQAIDASEHKSRQRPWPLMATAALALAAAVVLALFSANTERRLNDLQLAGAHVYRVPDGQIYRTSQRIYLVMRELPPLPADHVYQAWTLVPGAKNVAPSVTFVPDEHGFVVVSLPEAADQVAAVAVSVEPPGGSRAPTTKPLFVKPLI
jgi:anti-sigma-K factor RskA